MAWVMLKQKINELLDNETCYCVSLTSQFFFFVCVQKTGEKCLTIHQLSTGSPGVFSAQDIAAKAQREKQKEELKSCLLYFFTM